MDGMRRWWERVRGLLFKNQVEQEVHDEMSYHLEMEIRERVQSGLTYAEARRTAMRDFGGVERYRERAREVRWGRSLDVLTQDLRYALRTLYRSPGFTTVAVVTLALGIGATTSIFSVVNSVLLKPLPYGEPDEIVRILISWDGTPRAALSPAEYVDFRDRLDALSDMGAYTYTGASITGDGEPQRVTGAWLSAGAFASLGIPAARGRVFTRQEDDTNAQVIVISDGFWRERFGASPDVIGQTITLDGVEQEIIGVMPPAFRLPEVLFSETRVRFYGPLGITPEDIQNRGSHYLFGVGRLAGGISHERGRNAVEVMAAGWVEAYPDAYPERMGFQATAPLLATDIRGPVKTPLMILFGAVSFVLLIAVANVANLLISRADKRGREFALRATLGAGRGRLIKQVLVESVLLSTIGGGLGIWLAVMATGAIDSMIPSSLSWLGQSEIDVGVLGFGLAASLVTGLAFGLMPAFQVTQGGLAETLKEGARAATGGVQSQRIRRILVVGELAVALVLLGGGGLLVRSFAELSNVDPGFRTTEVVSTRVSLPASRYPTNEDVTAFFRDVLPQVAAIPGVQLAGAVTNLPLAGGLGDMNFHIEGREEPEGSVSPRADWQVVTPGYLEAMGLTLVRGRTIEAADDANAPGVVVVSQMVVDLHWPDEDPLGKRFVLGGGAGPGTVTIVGVVRDVRHEGLDQERKPQMYLAHDQFRFWGSGEAVRGMSLMAHSSLPITQLQGPITAAIHNADPLLPVSRFRTIDEVRSASVALPRLLMALVGVFSLVSLVLASVGIYGVMAYAVGRRAQEFGIRMALGATPSQVSGLVMGQGIRLAVTGIVLGLTGAYFLTGAMSSVLYEVSPTDPVTLGVVSIVLGGVAVLACWVPARRATRADPVNALRSD